jgi:PAS domain S-box-containing protein
MLCFRPVRADEPLPEQTHGFSTSIGSEGDITIRVGLYENAPKIYTSEDGKAAGFWPDLLRYIAAEEGWEIVWVSGTWYQNLQRLESNQIDLMPDVAWTKQRNERFEFSQEVVLLSWSRLYTHSDANILSILDLEGKTIGAVKGSYQLEGPENIRVFTRELGIDCTIIEMEDYKQIFKALNDREIDSGIANKDFGNRFEVEYDVERAPLIMQPSSLMFAFTKDAEITPYLIEKIDAQMRKLKQDQDSIYYQALEEHIGGEVTPNMIERIPGWVKFASGAALFGLIFLAAVGGVARIQVRRKTAALRVSEQNFRDLTENLLDGVAVVDESGRHLYVNPMYSEITGYNKDELLNMTGWELTRPEDRPKLQQKMKDHLKDKPITSRYRRITVRKDGMERLTEMSSTTITWQGKKRLLAIIRDTTDQVRAEEILREQHAYLEGLVAQRTAELKSSNEDLEAFAYSISHDLRAPLRQIDGFINIIQKKISPQSEEVQQYLNKIHNAASRMQAMISVLLDYSRLGRQELKLRPIQLDDLVKEVVRLQQKSSRSKKITWKIGKLDPVQGDLALLRLVFGNLINNAVKFTSPREEAVIEIGSTRKGEYIEVYVKDNGVGFDMKDAQKLFSVFQRLHGREDFPGTGIGLANVKRAVTRQGGETRGEGKVDQGAAFYVTLPAAKE